jgi:hypothetical protein
MKKYEVEDRLNDLVCSVFKLETKIRKNVIFNLIRSSLILVMVYILTYDLNNWKIKFVLFVLAAFFGHDLYIYHQIKLREMNKMVGLGSNGRKFEVKVGEKITD